MIALIGFPVVILGIILVPLPGPGLLVMFAGLFILSTEFEWAHKYVHLIHVKLAKIYHDAKAKAEKHEHKDKPKKK